MTTPTLYANTELVAVAWLSEIFGSSDMVGTTLPEDASKWAASGFVMVTGLGGGLGTEVPMANPIVAVDCWANRPSSNKAPYGFANNLAMKIWHSALLARPHKLSLPGQFPDAYFYTAQAGTPRRVPDPASYARYNLNLQVHWAPLAV